MNSPSPTSTWNRSWLVRFFRWSFTWRGARSLLLIFVWLSTTMALLYALENWRGRRAWDKYRQEMEARGEQLDFARFIPAAIPDDLNFAATPFLEGLFKNYAGYEPGDRFEAAQSNVGKGPRQDRGRRHMTDLVAWARGFAPDHDAGTPSPSNKPANLTPAARAMAAPVVIAALQPNEDIFTELRGVAGRPLSRYPINYKMDDPWGILLPHLAKLKVLNRRLQLKAAAELALGHSDKARDDVNLMLKLSESLRDEPLIISHLVRAACFHLALQPLWEGLNEHRWSDSQLQQFQTRLQTNNFLEEFSRAAKAERAAGVLTADLLYEQKYRLSVMFDSLDSSSGGGWPVNLLGRLAPRGWYRFEQVNYSRLFNEQFEGTMDPAHKQIFPQRHKERQDALQHRLGGGRLGRTLSGVLQHHLLASLMLPSLERAPVRSAKAQIVSDQAVIACALERYRLAEGSFPETLNPLVPRFLAQLPHDVINGEPYRYERNGSEAYALYSVGWNERDDGHTIGNNMFDDVNGDWVWEITGR